MLVGNEVTQVPSPSPSGNPYGFVGTTRSPILMYLGLWRGYEHRSITKIAWAMPAFQALIGITSIYNAIEDANVCVNHGASKNDLRRHYNREFNGDIAFAKQRYSEWLRVRTGPRWIISWNTRARTTLRVGAQSHRAAQPFLGRPLRSRNRKNDSPFWATLVPYKATRTT